jgi:Fic family protein
MNGIEFAADRDKLLAYLQQHRIFSVEDILWQWLSVRFMPSRDRLQRIQKLKAWLDEFRPLPPSVVSELRQRYVVRFTYHSNAIEGNTLTQSETELVLTAGITIGGKTLQEHLEVIGHQDAIEYIESLAQKQQTFGEWEIRQIHSLIVRKIDPNEAGSYRSLDVRAAGTEYVYPPHYLLPELMAEFAQWLNSKSAQALHPVLYAAEAHYRFVSIHPFRDGNGRTGRLLMNLLLLRAGYPIAIISTQHRQDYIESLVSGQRSKDWENFYTLILDAVEMALVEGLSVLITAADSQPKNSTIYREVLEFLQDRNRVQ